MISINDVEKIVIDHSCDKIWPCQHTSEIVLRDGRKVSGLDGFEICSIVSNIAKERINPGGKWDSHEVIEHFRSFRQSRPSIHWPSVETPNVVLNRIFRVNVAKVVHNFKRFSI